MRKDYLWMTFSWSNRLENMAWLSDQRDIKYTAENICLGFSEIKIHCKILKVQPKGYAYPFFPDLPTPTPTPHLSSDQIL